ncbi:MAG: MarR family transcriptional regulator [Candidatus Gastranaerophilaceae bacterium]
MKEREKCHYTESIIYAMEQTVIYFKIKGAQFFNQLHMGVTIDQFITLDAIYANNDICQRDLSKLILKDRSNTGRILNILEENGFIKRIVETKNNRLVKKIYITERGKRVIEDNQEKLRTAFEKVFDDVSEEEFAALRQTLDKLKGHLSRITSIQI